LGNIFKLDGLPISVYNILQHTYSAIPYHLISSGYAFPAWHYFFEFTRRCNLRCRMCQNITFLKTVPSQDQAKGELTAEEWKNIIDQISPFSLITFTGGEPLVRTDFFEVLGYASKNTRTHYLSNGTKFDESVARNSVELAPRVIGGKGLNFLGISLDGPKEVHDRIRNQNGAFDLSTNALRELKKIRKSTRKMCPILHVTTVIQKENVDALEYLPEAVASTGCNMLNLVMETRICDLPDLGERPVSDWKETDINWPRIDRKKLENAIENLENAAKTHNVKLRWPRMPKKELLLYYENNLNIEKYTCRGPWNNLIISYCGDMYLCGLCKPGNVRNDSLTNLWNSSRSKAFRKTCAKGLFPLCPGCCSIEFNGDI
jgi:MoaA/NifB/PqqE/SkfB family radical SAM enzyme